MKKVTSTLQIADKKSEVVFYYVATHYCRFHLQPWTVMCKGKAFYVNDITVEPSLGVITKETPNSERNKASFKTKGLLTIINYEDGTNEAIIK